MAAAFARRGYTLVEVLVVIAIVGVLVSLLVPAVQKVRSTAARVGCANIVKQIALAHHGCHDANTALSAGVRGFTGGELYSSLTWRVFITPHLEQMGVWGQAVANYKQPNPFLSGHEPTRHLVPPAFVRRADERTHIA